MKKLYLDFDRMFRNKIKNTSKKSIKKNRKITKKVKKKEPTPIVEKVVATPDLIKDEEE